MTKDGNGENRGENRAAEAFATLSGGKPDAPESDNPWKPAAILLLLLALALPMAFGIRQARRDLDRAERVEAAGEEVSAVAVLVEDGNLPEAVVALHDVGMRLDRVEGAEEAAYELKRAVADRIETLEGEIGKLRTDVEARDRLAGRRREALRHLLAGRIENARNRLSDDRDHHSEEIRRLCLRLDVLNRVIALEGEDRVRELTLFVEAWPLPALISELERAKAAVDHVHSVASSLERSGEALAAGDTDRAHELVRSALAASDLVVVEELLARSRAARRLAWAVRLTPSDPRGAAALYRTLALEEADPAARSRAAEIERDILKGHLLGRLRTMAGDASVEGRPESAWVLYAALASAGGGSSARDRSRAEWVLATRARIELLLRSGGLEAARKLAREVPSTESSRFADLRRVIEATIAERDRFELFDRVDEALEDGATAHAERLLAGRPLPEDLAARIAAQKRGAALARAGDAIATGDASAAGKILREAGIRKDAAAAPILARVELLAGDVEAGLAGIPTDPAIRASILTSAAVGVAERDPERAAVLFLALREITGPRADLDAAIARVLLATVGEETAKPFWEAVRDEALRHAPLPEPEKLEPPVEKAPGDEEQPPRPRNREE